MKKNTKNKIIPFPNSRAVSQKGLFELWLWQFVILWYGVYTDHTEVGRSSSRSPNVHYTQATLSKYPCFQTHVFSDSFRARQTIYSNNRNFRFQGILQ